MGFIALIFNQNAAEKIPKDNRISSVVTGDFQSSLLIFQVYVILLILLHSPGTYSNNIIPFWAAALKGIYRSTRHQIHA